LDASSRTSPTYWQYILSFVNMMIDNFAVSQTQIRVALIRYAVDADVQFYLCCINDKNTIKQLVSNTQLIGGQTANLDRALDLARTSVFTGARSSTWKIAFVFIERLPASQLVITAANNAKAAGIEIVPSIVLNTGLVDMSTFYQIYSSTEQEMPDYNHYTVRLHADVLASSGACKTGTPTPPSSTSTRSTTNTTASSIRE